MQFKGAYSALITPFKDGRIDEETYRNFIEWQIEQGIDGLVPCGTTGESATLDHGEHKKAISICVDQAKSRVPVVAGAGSNATAEAIDLAGHARDAGADAALRITP
ncbi:MAG: dihydrodipicolinate synthase family protein, partial [Desulfonatronovibrionaceae bacterium]